MADAKTPSCFSPKNLAASTRMRVHKQHFLILIRIVDIVPVSFRFSVMFRSINSYTLKVSQICNSMEATQSQGPINGHGDPMAPIPAHTWFTDCPWLVMEKFRKEFVEVEYWHVTFSVEAYLEWRKICFCRKQGLCGQSEET